MAAGQQNVVDSFHQHWDVSSAAAAAFRAGDSYPRTVVDALDFPWVQDCKVERDCLA